MFRRSWSLFCLELRNLKVYAPRTAYFRARLLQYWLSALAILPCRTHCVGTPETMSLHCLTSFRISAAACGSKTMINGCGSGSGFSVKRLEYRSNDSRILILLMALFKLLGRVSKVCRLQSRNHLLRSGLGPNPEEVEADLVSWKSLEWVIRIKQN